MRFKTKLILLISCTLFIATLLLVVISVIEINDLSNTATQKVETGLLASDREYFENYVVVNAHRTDDILQKAVTEVQELAGVAQTLEDKQEDGTGSVANNVNQLTPSTLQFNSQGKWYQNSPSNPSVVTVWPYLLQKDGQISPNALGVVNQTAPLDLFFPIFNKFGVEKSQISYVGPPDVPISRIFPWTNFADSLAKTNPKNFSSQNLWNYFPPTIQSSWKKWAANPSSKPVSTNEVVFTTPYLDLTGNNLVMTVFNPVWDTSRKNLKGLVSIDLSLSQVTDLVRNLKVAKTGFAFLAQSNGNVIAVNDDGQKVLNLQTQQVNTGGFNGLFRFLQSSNIPGIAHLKLPSDTNVVLNEIQIQNQTYEIVMERLSPINFIADPVHDITAESWTLGFVVSREELLTTLRSTQSSILNGAQSNLFFTVIVSLLASIVVILISYWLSNRMTRTVTVLSQSAREIERRNYNVKVAVTTDDEIGQLGRAFNSMVETIKSHTENLEEMVRQRTLQLQLANQEIVRLNQNLESENLRMKSELEVTRQLQQMILPKKQELESITELDIASFMEPADEVGGDYYDVLQGLGMVKIGIGDVTGHGLESGVLMLMVQTAVRTLLATKITDSRRFITILNQVIYDNIQRMSSDKVLSLSLIDYSKGTLSLSGQHEELIVVRSNGLIEHFDTNDLGFPIGLEQNIESLVAQTDVKLKTDDVVILYTDGITEAEDLFGTEYGLDRLCQVVMEHRSETASQIKTSVILDLKEHIGFQTVYDDITLLVIKQRDFDLLN